MSHLSGTMGRFYEGLSCFLVVVLTVTSCARTPEQQQKISGEVISDDAPWYEYDRVDLTAGYKAEAEYSDLFMEYIGKIGESNLIKVSGCRTIPDDVNWDEESMSDYQVLDIAVYNNDWELTNTINLMSLYEGEYDYLEELNVQQDCLEAKIVTYDEQTWEQAVYIVQVDPSTGHIGDREAAPRLANIGNSPDYQQKYIVGEYTVDVFSGDCLIFQITDDDGNINTINTEAYTLDYTLNYVEEILAIGDNKAFISALGPSRGGYYILDLSELTMSELNLADSMWLTSILWGDIIENEGKYFTSNLDGVFEIDFDAYELIPAFDFNNSNFSRFECQHLKLLDCSEDEIVFIEEKNNFYVFFDDTTDFYIVRFKLADSNPNSGKTMLTIGCMSDSGITEAIAAAVCEFNNTNSECYIVYDNSYINNENFMDFNNITTEEDYETELRNAGMHMSDQLAVDLISGDAPDIIIGAFNYGQLNKADYLIDLSQYVANLSDGDYFTSVIHDCYTGDALYQIPLSFSVQGILTLRDNVAEGQVGFTYDEYIRFVDEVCNGRDPVALDRLEYFLSCERAMSDRFLSSGNADFSNEEFSSLAEYCRDFVNDRPRGYDPYASGVYIPPVAVYGTFNGFGSYLQEMNSDRGPSAQVILGLPSCDARGPQINILNSAGISASSVNVEACWNFIEKLLGEDVQTMLARKWSFPVNRNVFTDISRQMIDSYNNALHGGHNYSFTGEHVCQTDLDYSIVDLFASETIGSARVSITDPAVRIVIYEEIPAYFAGQKSLEQVTEIIENRVNTIIAER